MSHPLFAMIYGTTQEEILRLIDEGHQQNCDGFGFGLEKLKIEERSTGFYRELFSACKGKPTFVTSYRTHENVGKTDEELSETLFTLARCGATYVDVMGDLFDATPTEMTFDGVAVEKQKKMIADLHKLGVKVIQSCHQKAFLVPEEAYRYLASMKERGADICKLVNRSGSEEQFAQNLSVMKKAKANLNAPFLYLTVGEFQQPNRLYGWREGNCLTLCTLTPPSFQPQIATMKEILSTEM